MCKRWGKFVVWFADKFDGWCVGVQKAWFYTSFCPQTPLCFSHVFYKSGSVFGGFYTESTGLISTKTI
jgi:hypothetical protein